MDNTKQHWLNTFQTNIERNRQLQFSKNFALSFIEGDEPRAEMFTLKDIVDNSDKETCLAFVIDKREPIYEAVAKKPKVSAMIYFPLTKEKYVFQSHAEIINSADNELVKKVWNKDLCQEERNNFTRSRPNDLKVVQPETYNPQDIEKISVNFAVLLLSPLVIEHALLKMPEVVADARNPVFESEFRPYKKEKKYRFEKKDTEWTMKEVNP